MKLELKKLKPNPKRDFKIDPLDQRQVKKLVDSINEYGFWGGTVCRHGKNNGDFEVVAGWTRVQAAIEKGIRSADLFVGDFDDLATARAYAIENTTQRGNTVAAIAGSIAMAIAMLAEAILRGEEHLRQICHTSKKAWETARGNLIKGDGIGVDLIEKFLEGTGINHSDIREQLANLKKSGDYKRIVTEVTERVKKEAEVVAVTAKKESEREEAVATATEAEAAKEKVSHDEKEFDFQGVRKHLTNDHQIKAFREMALKKGNQPYLPVENQAALAAALVKEAKELKEELTGRFIKENMMTLLSDAKAHERKMSKEEKAKLAAKSLQSKFNALCEEFRTGFKKMRSAGAKITELMEDHRDAEFRIPDSLVDNIVYTIQMLEKLAAGLAKRSSSAQTRTLAKLKH